MELTFLVLVDPLPSHAISSANEDIIPSYSLGRLSQRKTQPELDGQEIPDGLLHCPANVPGQEVLSDGDATLNA